MDALLVMILYTYLGYDFKVDFIKGEEEKDDKFIISLYQ